MVYENMVRRMPVRNRRYTRKTKVSKPVKVYVQKAIKKAPETKINANSAYNGSSMAYDTPVFGSLSTIPQGDASSSRDGDRLRLMKISGRLDVNVNAGSVARVIIFQWKPNDADDVPSTSTVLQFGALVSNSVNYPVNPEKSDKLKINVLWDKRYVQKDTSTHVIDFVNITKFKNPYIYYNSGGVTTGKNNIYIMAFSNTAAAASEPLLYAQLNTYFKDM